MALVALILLVVTAVALVGTSAALLGASNSLLARHERVGAWLVAVTVPFPGIFGVTVALIGLNAAPLAAFAEATTGRARIEATLRGTWSLLAPLAAPCLFDVLAGVPLLACAWAFLGTIPGTSEPAVLVAFYAAIAAVVVFFVVWIHGALPLIGGARLARGATDLRDEPSARPLHAIGAGSLPFLAAAAVAGSALIPHAPWGPLPEAALQATLVIAVLLAHLVSCAFAVAVASQGDARP